MNRLRARPVTTVKAVLCARGEQRSWSLQADATLRFTIHVNFSKDYDYAKEWLEKIH